MIVKSELSKQVLLAGLDRMLADQLGDYLRARGLNVKESAQLEAATDETDSQKPPYDLVFCETHHPGLMKLLSAVSSPVVVVSRTPEVNDWLDAMDAGAAG